jgi:hypothetical protein
MSHANAASSKRVQSACCFWRAISSAKMLFDIAARVCAGATQQLEALGVAFLGGSENWGKAVVVTLVDVATPATLFPGSPAEINGVELVFGNRNTSILLPQDRR